MMNSFISDDDEKWLMFNAKFSSADERVFLCGASSKDAGARITSIVEDEDELTAQKKPVNCLYLLLLL